MAMRASVCASSRRAPLLQCPRPRTIVDHSQRKTPQHSRRARPRAPLPALPPAGDSRARCAPQARAPPPAFPLLRPPPRGDPCARGAPQTCAAVTRACLRCARTERRRLRDRHRRGWPEGEGALGWAAKLAPTPAPSPARRAHGAWCLGRRPLGFVPAVRPVSGTATARPGRPGRNAQDSGCDRLPHHSRNTPV